MSPKSDQQAKFFQISAFHERNHNGAVLVCTLEPCSIRHKAEFRELTVDAVKRHIWKFSTGHRAANQKTTATKARVTAHMRSSSSPAMGREVSSAMPDVALSSCSAENREGLKASAIDAPSPALDVSGNSVDTSHDISMTGVISADVNPSESSLQAEKEMEPGEQAVATLEDQQINDILMTLDVARTKQKPLEEIFDVPQDAESRRRRFEAVQRLDQKSELVSWTNQHHLSIQHVKVGIFEYVRDGHFTHRDSRTYPCNNRGKYGPLGQMIMVAAVWAGVEKGCKVLHAKFPNRTSASIKNTYGYVLARMEVVLGPRTSWNKADEAAKLAAEEPEDVDMREDRPAAVQQSIESSRVSNDESLFVSPGPQQVLDLPPIDSAESRSEHPRALQEHQQNDQSHADDESLFVSPGPQQVPDLPPIDSAESRSEHPRALQEHQQNDQSHADAELHPPSPVAPHPTEPHLTPASDETAQAESPLEPQSEICPEQNPAANIHPTIPAEGKDIIVPPTEPIPAPTKDINVRIRDMFDEYNGTRDFRDSLLQIQLFARPSAAHDRRAEAIRDADCKMRLAAGRGAELKRRLELRAKIKKRKAEEGAESKIESDQQPKVKRAKVEGCEKSKVESAGRPTIKRAKVEESEVADEAAKSEE